MRSLIPLLLLTLVLAACADGQSTGATSTEAPGTEQVTATSTDQPTDDPATSSGPAGEDTPIPVEGEDDIGDGQGAPAPLAEAPDFGISSETDSGAVAPYTSCWSAPTGGEETEGMCADGVPQPDALTLTGADQLVVTYAEGELTAGASAPGALDAAREDPVDVTDLPVTQDNPGIWLVDISGLEAGDHVVQLAWYGEQGDAFTAFTLTVER